jgi:hypothetical protein
MYYLSLRPISSGILISEACAVLLSLLGGLSLLWRFGLADVSSLLAKMKAATMVKRGDPDIKNTVESARDEMNRFTAYYRRNNKVAGAASFSTLYTAISTLSGHFQNYGPEYPVPAKRQKVFSFCVGVCASDTMFGSSNPLVIITSLGFWRICFL